MPSKALDFVTMGYAFNKLFEAYPGPCELFGINKEHQAFLAWYDIHREEISKLSGLEALASTKYVDLNAFLKARGFDPMFQPFAGIGVASVLDMLVEWLHGAKITTIVQYNMATDQITYYPAFKVPAEGVELYDVRGFKEPLVRLMTSTGHSLWLMKADEPATGIELAILAQHILGSVTGIRHDRWIAGAKVPMLEMDLKPDLSWMMGLDLIGPILGTQDLDQAFQQFKLRANERGARVKVATGFATRSIQPLPYEFNDPFIGFFTQPGNNSLAMAAFWADTDTWRNPEGTLEEL